MKKFFGALFLVTGMMMITAGTYIIRDLSSSTVTAGQHQQPAAVAGKIDIASGYGLILGGVIIFVTGLVLAITKTSAQRRKEAELEAFKNTFSNGYQQGHANAHIHSDAAYGQLERLVKLKERGVITEEEFKRQKEKILK